MRLEIGQRLVGQQAVEAVGDGSRNAALGCKLAVEDRVDRQDLGGQRCRVVADPVGNRRRSGSA